MPKKQGRVPPGPISEHSAALFFVVETNAKKETDFPLSGSVGRSGRVFAHLFVVVVVVAQ